MEASNAFEVRQIREALQTGADVTPILQEMIDLDYIWAIVECLDDLSKHEIKVDLANLLDKIRKSHPYLALTKIDILSRYYSKEDIQSLLDNDVVGEDYIGDNVYEDDLVDRYDDIIGRGYKLDINTVTRYIEKYSDDPATYAEFLLSRGADPDLVIYA